MQTSIDEQPRHRGPDGPDRGACLSFYRTLSSTVSIVSARCPQGRPLGLTISAVTALSAEPPLVAACLAHRSQTLQAAVDTGRFGVHVLHANQHGLATEFATSASARFRGHRYTVTHGVPILSEVDIWCVCELVDTRIYGDRTQLVGRLIATHRRATALPLVWHDSSFLDVGTAQSPRRVE